MFNSRYISSYLKSYTKYNIYNINKSCLRGYHANITFKFAISNETNANHHLTKTNQSSYTHHDVTLLYQHLFQLSNDISNFNNKLWEYLPSWKSQTHKFDRKLSLLIYFSYYNVIRLDNNQVLITKKIEFMQSFCRMNLLINSKHISLFQLQYQEYEDMIQLAFELKDYTSLFDLYHIIVDIHKIQLKSCKLYELLLQSQQEANGFDKFFYILSELKVRNIETSSLCKNLILQIFAKHPLKLWQHSRGFIIEEIIKALHLNKNVYSIIENSNEATLHVQLSRQYNNLLIELLEILFHAKQYQEILDIWDKVVQLITKHIHDVVGNDNIHVDLNIPSNVIRYFGLTLLYTNELEKLYQLLYFLMTSLNGYKSATNSLEENITLPILINEFKQVIDLDSDVQLSNLPYANTLTSDIISLLLCVILHDVKDSNMNISPRTSKETNSIHSNSSNTQLAYELWSSLILKYLTSMNSTEESNNRQSYQLVQVLVDSMTIISQSINHIIEPCITTHDMIISSNVMIRLVNISNFFHEIVNNTKSEQDHPLYHTSSSSSSSFISSTSSNKMNPFLEDRINKKQMKDKFHKLIDNSYEIEQLQAYLLHELHVRDWESLCHIFVMTKDIQSLICLFHQIGSLNITFKLSEDFYYHIFQTIYKYGNKTIVLKLFEDFMDKHLTLVDRDDKQQQPLKILTPIILCLDHLGEYELLEEFLMKELKTRELKLSIDTLLFSIETFHRIGKIDIAMQLTLILFEVSNLENLKSNSNSSNSNLVIKQIPRNAFGEIYDSCIYLALKVFASTRCGHYAIDILHLVSLIPSKLLIRSSNTFLILGFKVSYYLL